MPSIDCRWDRPYIVLVPEGRHGEVDAKAALCAWRGLGVFDPTARAVSFWRSLAGLFADCAGMRASLMSRFSPSVLRCFGAATIEASMIWPLMARNPAAAKIALNR